MRALFIPLLLTLTLLVTACGGGDSNDAANDDSGLPAGIAGNGSGDAGDDATTAPDDATTADGEAPVGAASGATSAAPTATATQARMLSLPTGTPRPTSTPFPTATPLPIPPTATEDTRQPTEAPSLEATVEVISTHVYRNVEAGSAIIFGEVQNMSDVPATGVIVSARLFNANGDRVGRGESEAVGKTVMNPGDVAGFSIIVTFDGGTYVEWSSEELVADHNFTSEDIVAAYTPELSISDDQLVPPATGFDFVDVAGNLTNDSSETLTFVQVGATAYDAAGNVISVDSFVTTEPLAPGATIPFTVEFSRGRLKDFPASYAFVVEGLAGE